MNVVVDNIVGLYRFLFLLIRTFLIPRRNHKPQIPVDREKDDGHDRFDNIIGPSVPLVAAEPCFCPVCHVLTAFVRHTDKGTDIIRNGRVALTVSNTVVVGAKGKIEKGFPISCPNGHKVIIEGGQDEL